jgi:tetratricopeptide (TPR) repeat protein
MLENFDYDYEPQYETNWQQAKVVLAESLEIPGNEIWEHFMMVGVIGVEAIHATRRYNYVGALSKAMEAMRYLERCKQLAPDFPDLVLADGINNYWRSVVALNTKLIPDGEDRRAEGIAQMKYVESNAIFIAAPTTLALTYTYLEERDMKRALGTASRGHQLYPDNVINNLVLARIYIYMRRFEQSEAICLEILEDAPDNERVHYYLGLIYSRTKRMDQAIAELERYLGYDLIDEYRATTLYRLGGFHYRKKHYQQAEEYYKQAVKVNKHKGAKRRLERMKRLQKEGIIDY